MSDNKRGKFLQQLRVEKKLTQKEVGDILHYSDKAVSNWEKGKTLPNNPETLMKLSELYGISLEELLYGERKIVLIHKKFPIIWKQFIKITINHLKKF